MNVHPTSIYIIVAILVAFSGIISYIIYNLLRKVEKYEDLAVEQTQYLVNVSNLIVESQKHLDNLDERGVFKSDDEVGYFFENIKLIQAELNKYELPQEYAQEEIKS